jgi:pilus assembly protein CpaC
VVTLEFKKFGVGLAFTPTVMADGLINLKIEPEVSQIDPTNSVQVGGVSIPSLIVRRANTTVELRDGQSFAIAGLLQSINEVNQSQLPWIGNIPILGALFRSAAYQKRETDLVIIITPRLVQPSRPGDLVRTPLDNTLPPNDADFFAGGLTEITPKMARLMRTPEPHGFAATRPFTGHVIDLPPPAVTAGYHGSYKETGHVLVSK